jgi:hypothetical protein
MTSARGSGRVGARWTGAILDLYAGFVLLYLFLPIFVIVSYSFNKPEGKFNFVWKAFSLDAWRDPFLYPALVDAMKLSLKVAAVSTTVATLFGALIALALCRYSWRGSGAVNMLLVLPLTTPEVVLGSSLLSLFLASNVASGFWTIVIAHVMFSVSYVALTVKARIRGFDWTLEEAAMDPAPHRPRHRRRGDAGLRAVARRFHHHPVQRRHQGHLSPLCVWRAPGRVPAADQRAGDDDPGGKPHPARDHQPVAEPSPETGHYPAGPLAQQNGRNGRLAPVLPMSSRAALRLPYPSGSFRTRFPVSWNMALATAGASGGTPGSPTPVGAASDGTMCTSTFGIWSIRRTL